MGNNTQQYKGVKIRLYPTVEQEQLILQSIGNARFVWNQMLWMLKERYKNNSELKFPSAYDLSNLVKVMKLEYPFLTESDSRSLQIVCQNLAQSYKMFFNKQRGFPRFKNRNKDRGYTSTSTCRQLDKRHIKLPKLGNVKCNNHLMIPEKDIAEFTILRTKSGKYFCSIIYKCESQALERTGKSIGLDFGVADLVIGSEDDVRFPTKKWGYYHNQLSIWQKKYSRRRHQAKQQGKELQECKNVEKARLQVAKYHEKIANCRKDYLHKVSKQLVEEYDLIVIEDLKVSNMMKNHKLARSIANQCWRELRTMLEYKCSMYGKTLIAVDPKYTSQMCSSCGSHEGKKALHIREWVCQSCGTIHDRDINASINIKQRGLEQAIVR